MLCLCLLLFPLSVILWLTNEDIDALLCLSAVGAKIVKGPDNVGAQVGKNMEMKCLFSHRTCQSMSWTRADQTGSPTILYAANDMPFSYDGRYSVSVSARGECTLSINRVELSDAGTFTCSELVPGASQQSKHTATLTVVGMYCDVYFTTVPHCVQFIDSESIVLEHA